MDGLVLFTFMIAGFIYNMVGMNRDAFTPRPQWWNAYDWELPPMVRRKPQEENGRLETLDGRPATPGPHLGWEVMPDGTRRTAAVYDPRHVPVVS